MTVRAIYRAVFARSLQPQCRVVGNRTIFTTMPTMKDLEKMVRVEPVTFDLSCGEQVTVESHIQDTLPSGSIFGTVLCLHGSPGSHKDFKYITPHLFDKGIRVIGINFPDYGHAKLRFDNIERNNYVKAVIDQVGVNNRLVVMGHSRGCENATGTAALLSDRLSGLVLLNPTGLRPHRGLRPYWLIHFVLWLHSLSSFMEAAIENFLHWFYNKIGLRLDNGKRAVTCVRTMSHIELDKIKSKIDAVNSNKQVKVLQAYSGRDILIEPTVSKELAECWHDHQEVICSEKSEESAQRATEETTELFKAGTKSVSVNFKKEDHFLQKHQAKFVADSIESILSV